ncbi:MAG: FAD-dependent oxidoreductase [Pseudomonadota bacterium]
MDHARVVIIGGGIAGCATLYELTQMGWTDVILLERDELTSGTTWHSAAQVTNFGMNQTMIGLKSHSIALYRDLAADPDYPVGYHYGDGGIRLANTEAQMDGYRHFASLAAGMGVEYEVIDAAECARRHPLISTENLLGGLWDPHDGDIDPAQLCQALAFRARRAGATLRRFCPVTGLTEKPDGWIVHTEKGDITCEIVVNAGGYRCNEVAAMMGVTHPVMSMEHQYFVTEEIPQIVDAGHRMPLLRCPISDYYSRQEKTGLLVGFYEQDCRTWGMDGIDPKFSNDLCPDDLDRVMDVLEGAFERMPVLQEVGIKRVVNGPITYSMDGAPLVGPIPGKRNAFCIVGLRAGVGEGGGHGWLLAQQIVNGEACYDTWGLDPRRFGRHASVELTALRAIEDYQNEFRFHFPHEHRPSGRPARVTPLTGVLAAEGAEFTVVNGWERMDFVKPTADFEEEHCFRYTAVDDIVATEVAAVQKAVGLTEVNGFTRLTLGGADLEAFLDRVICSRVPRRAGRVGLCYLLNHHGCIKSEATVARLPGGEVWYGAAAAAEIHDPDWLRAQVAPGEDVTITDLTTSHVTLVLAGPKARAVLADVARGDWSANAFPWLSARRAELGQVPVVVMAVSFSGELAYEIHVPVEQSLTAWTCLRAAGAAHGLRLFGARAVESMRLEKGFRHWKADLITEFDPYESGLDRFVRPGGGYIGAEALAARDQKHAFVTLRVDAEHAAPQPGDSIRQNGSIVGTVTSAARGHRVGATLAMGFVDAGKASEGTDLMVDVVGLPKPAQVVAPCQYDPEFARLRA